MIRKAVLAICCALAAVPVLRPIIVPAQEPGVPLALVRISSMSPWVDSSHPFTLALRVTNTAERALEGVRVVVVFHGRVVSRSQLRQALDQGVSGSTGTFNEAVTASLQPGEQASVSFTRQPSLLPSRRTGVYPIDIVVRHSAGETVLHSALPVFNGALPEPLNLVWVVPVTRPITVSSDGSFTPDALTALGLDELVQQLSVLAAAPGANLTLAPSGALIDQLRTIARGFVLQRDGAAHAVADGSAESQRARDALTALRAAAAAGEIATVPYAPADPRSLGLNGLEDDLLRHVTLGREVESSALGVEPAPILVTAGGALDAGSAAALASLGISSFVIDPAMLTAQPTEPFDPALFGPSRPVSLKIGASEASALIADGAMSQRVDASNDGVLLAQSMIAETASAYLELPLFSAQRVLVVSSSRTPSPVALRQAIAAFKAAPWVTLRRASIALATLPPQGPPATLVPLGKAVSKFLPASRAARKQLTVFNSITVERLAEVDTLDRSVLMSESAEWAAAPAGGRALADAVTARVRRVVHALGVARRQVTLTSRSGQVPVTVFNQNPFPVRVRLSVQSPKVTFPSGSTRTPPRIDPPSGSVDIPVTARAAGSFPLDVRIETPDGAITLARGQVILRSTAISAVAISVVGGSAALLLFAWARRSTRRSRPSSSD